MIERIIKKAVLAIVLPHIQDTKSSLLQYIKATPVAEPPVNSKVKEALVLLDTRVKDLERGSLERVRKLELLVEAAHDTLRVYAPTAEVQKFESMKFQLLYAPPIPLQEKEGDTTNEDSEQNNE